MIGWNSPVVSIASVLSWIVGVVFLLSIPHQNEFSYIAIGFTVSFICYLQLNASQAKGSMLKYLLVTGLIVRLVSLFCLPQLSDDIYRFIWDGRLIHAGVNPYEFLPTDAIGFLSSDDKLELLATMNSPNYYTVYPPFSQFVFYLSTWDGTNVFMSAFLMKCIFLIAELLTCFYSLKILRLLKRSPSFILLYWLNPLIIVEGLGNLHFEIIMICLLCMSFYYWTIGRFYLSISFLAFSVAAKLVTLLLLPYMLWKHRHHLWLRLLLLFTVASFLLFMPLLIGVNFGAFFSSIDLYFRKFEFNGGIYYIVRALGYYMVDYNLIAFIGPSLGLLFGFFVLWWTIKEKSKSIISFLYIILLVYLSLATTIHPWYLSVPIFCSIFINNRIALVWSSLIWLSYINYSYDPYCENLWVVAMEYTLLVVYVWYSYHNNDLKISTKS